MAERGYPMAMLLIGSRIGVGAKRDPNRFYFRVWASFGAMRQLLQFLLWDAAGIRICVPFYDLDIGVGQQGILSRKGLYPSGRIAGAPGTCLQSHRNDGICTLLWSPDTGVDPEPCTPNRGVFRRFCGTRSNLQVKNWLQC